MKTVGFVIALLVMLALVQGQLNFASFNGDFSSLNAPSDGLPLADLITVANHYGCKTWQNEQCLECSNGYFFNKKGVCCEVPPLCNKFNRAQGICEECYQGYTVVNGCCEIAKQDVGCAKWNGNKCIECSKRWYFNSQGTCVPVSDKCATWNNGDCLGCYGGYILNNGQCVINSNPFTGASDPLCATWNGNTCAKCATNAYFDKNRVCQAVSDQCQTYDPIDGFCLTCYGGYTLKNSNCVQSAIQKPSDVGCALWNGDLTVCLKCSERYYFSSSKLCTPVADLCQTWNSNGACTSCYDGYDLSNGVCSLSTKNLKPSDVGCATWDWKRQTCLQCSNNWVFNSQRVCVPVSDQCASSDSTGACVACYKGYTLRNGKCIESELEKVSDVGCATWNWDKKICLKCSNNWVFNTRGVCVPVSDQCATFDKNGACLSCYSGYNLKNGQCIEAPIQKVSDVGCAKWNWKQQICLACSQNWVFNSKGVCVPVSDQCASFDKNGACLSCYSGYNLKNGQCIEAPIEKVSDVGCGLWDWSKRKCLQCSDNWVFNSNGVCVPVSDQCATFDKNGACLTCYLGYSIKGGKCVENPIEKVYDVGCSLWDWSNRRCLQCSDNWVFNSKRVCVPVSDQCASHSSSGACVSCYLGYNLENGKCVEAPIQKVSDVGCATWDWSKQICLACSDRWVFNSNRVCVPVSDQCATFANNGACASCYKGYNLKNGKCEEAPIQKVADVGCGTWDWDRQVCLKCSQNWVFNSNRVCVPVSDSCETHNDSGACTSCYKGYVLNGGKCEMGNSLCASSDNNGACTQCYTGYLLNNGNCVPVSKLANLALYYAMCCPERLNTLSGEVASFESSP